MFKGREYCVIQSCIRVKEILACFYQHRKLNYLFSSSSHSYFEFTYVEADNCIRLLIIKSIFYILHNVCCIIPTKNILSCLTILFEMEMNIPENLKNKIILTSQQMRLEMKRFIKEIQFDSWMNTEMSLVIFQRILIQALWGQRSSKKESRELVTDDELEPILLYIENHIDKDISVEELRRIFSVSRSSLQGMFRNALDLTPKQYIADVKMKRAKLLLQEHGYTISEIAYQLGYHSLYYFSRKFKAYFGISPSEYTKSLPQ